MQHDPLFPPIASPHGAPPESAISKTVSDVVAIVPVHFSFESALRTTVSNSLCPANFFSTVAVAASAAAMLIGTIPTHSPHWFRGFYTWEIWFMCYVVLSFAAVIGEALWLLVFVRHIEVVIQRDGISVRSSKWNKTLRWEKIIWIVHFDGDVWLATKGSRCLIPRESFASRDLDRKFLEVV